MIDLIDHIIHVPMISSSTIFLWIISIVVLGGLGLAFYLVFKAFYSDYKYRSFSLPLSQEYVINDNAESEKVINPIKESKFKIEKSTGNELIDEARRTSEEMFKQEEERLRLKRKQEIKRMKKEINKKAAQKS